MAVDVKKLFNEELPAALQKNAEDAKTIGAKYQMNITGEGSWFIDVSATGPKCVAGTELAAGNCTMTIASKTSRSSSKIPQQNWDAALLCRQAQGRRPSQMLAMKLNKLFGYK